MKQLILKNHEDRRIRDGHLWIFSNEVDTKKSPLHAFTKGENVDVVSSTMTALGTGTINPNTLITCRLHARTPNTPLTKELIAKRIAEALHFRERSFASPYYRLLHGEGDFLPGLIIDRYDTHLTVQITTYAMEMQKEVICDVLAELLHPKSIRFANNLPTRSLEGLDTTSQCVGDVPYETVVQENGCTFRVPIIEGQKTGWFYDQRANRLLAARFAQNRTVLDAFCYLGGFGCVCAKNGAKEVTFLDASKKALSYAEANYFANTHDSSTPPQMIQEDGFQGLKKLLDSTKRFGLVSIDPPALIKHRKQSAEGLAGYRTLNLLAMRLLEPHGILVTSSCSYHLRSETLQDCLLRAANKEGRTVQILATGRQDIDHPERLGMPETSYLKCIICAVHPKD